MLPFTHADTSKILYRVSECPIHLTTKCLVPLLQQKMEEIYKGETSRSTWVGVNNVLRWTFLLQDQNTAHTGTVWLTTRN